MDNIIQEESLSRWKEAFARDGIAYDSDDDYYEAISNLLGFFNILIEIDREQSNQVASSTDDGLYLIDKDGKRIIL